MESRRRSRNEIPSEWILKSANECEVFSEISHGELARKPLPAARVNGGSVYSEGNDRQGFLDAQVRTTSKNVTSLTSVASENAGSGARTQGRRLE